MFGNRFEGGFAELAELDGNGDGVIDAADARFAELRVWQDRNLDGVSQALKETSRGKREPLKGIGDPLPLLAANDRDVDVDRSAA